MAVRIIPLKKSDKIYTCNSYLILGDWNRVGDLNTVIDPGTDDFILEEIEKLSTGCGKVAVEQVILTHNHFDHNGGVMALKKRYGAKVRAYVDGPGVDALLNDGQFIRAGDDFLEVLHTPGHSSDSICLYAPSEKTLFVGDTQIRVLWPGDMHSPEYVEALFKVASRDIHTIFSGHDEPVTSGCNEVILMTMRNVSMAKFNEWRGKITNAGQYGKQADCSRT